MKWASEGPGQEHRAGGVEALRVDGRNGPAGGAEQRQRPADGQAGQAGVEGGGADAVVHRRHPGAPGQRTNPLAEFCGVVGVGEHLVGAGLAWTARSFSGVETVVMTRAPSRCAHCVRISPTPPAPACTSTASPALHRIHRLQQVVRGQALQQYRRRHLGRHAVRHLGGQRCWRSGEFGVAAGRRRGDHPVADAEPSPTPSPMAATVPHASEPRTNGNSRGYCPERK